MNLKEEKEKELYSHKLEVRRILLNKLLLALVIAIIAFAGKIYLEDYRADLVQRRFLLENRLTGLKNIRTAYSCLVRNMIYCINLDPKRKLEIHSEYQNALAKFLDVGNQWTMLFSDRIGRLLRYHAWIHESVAYEHVHLDKSHYLFLGEIFEHFDQITRIALWEETFGVENKQLKTSFEFEEWNTEKIKESGPKEFFTVNKNKWENNLKSKLP